MVKKITRSQYAEIQEAFEEGYRELHQALAEHTGIVAYSHEAYSYWDGDNWVGNSEDFDLDVILENAYIEVVEDGS